MSKVQVNTRLSPEAVITLETFARITGGTITDAVEAFIPSWLVVHAYENDLFGSKEHGETDDFRAWDLKLRADGARQRMLSQPRPIAPYFLRGLDATELLAYYADYREALPASLYECVVPEGVTPPETKPKPIYLAQVPDKGIWADRGIEGWAVLTSRQRFTETGIEESPEPEDGVNHA